MFSRCQVRGLLFPSCPHRVVGLELPETKFLRLSQGCRWRASIARCCCHLLPEGFFPLLEFLLSFLCCLLLGLLGYGFLGSGRVRARREELEGFLFHLLLVRYCLALDPLESDGCSA